MSGNFSLSDLFKIGLDKDKFMQTHAEMMSNGASGTSSIFSDGMENATGNIFDTLDTNKNGVLDQDELVSLRSMGQSGNNDKIEDDDLAVLYQKSIENTLGKYGNNLSPDVLFNNAQNASASSGGMVSSDYIQRLDEDIASLNELINKTQTDKDEKVAKFQNEIDDYIQQAKDLDDETKAKHHEKTLEINRLNQEKSEYEKKIAKAKNEQKSEQNQVTILNREIDRLDPEKDSDAVAAKRKELEDAQSKLKGLEGDISGYQGKIAEISGKITSTQQELEQIQTDISQKDASLKDKISQNKTNIKKEQDTCNSKVESYKQQLEALQNAREYAYQNIEIGADNGSPITNNPKSIEELEQMGIHYSSEKGTKLAQSIKGNLKGFTGYCSRHVSNALAASGLGNERTASAYQMADRLAQNKNFKEIKVTSQEQLKSLPAGCVVVYAAGAARYNAKHGHIEVTLGDGTAGSDGQTRNMRFTDKMRVFVPVG